MSIRPLLTLIGIFPTASPAVDPSPDPVEAEYARLQGEWRCESAERVKGKDALLKGVLDEWVKHCRVEIKGREATATILMAGDGRKDLMAFRVALAIDPAKDPKAVDLTGPKVVSLTPFDPKGPTRVYPTPVELKDERPPRGIYRLDGNTLQFGMLGGRREEGRPRSFDFAAEPGVVVFTLKRSPQK
jgi:uncharacterized protein (TIGR03067 family)